MNIDRFLYSIGIYFVAVITGLFFVAVLLIGINDIFNWLNSVIHLNLGYKLLGCTSNPFSLL